MIYPSRASYQQTSMSDGFARFSVHALCFIGHCIITCKPIYADHLSNPMFTLPEEHAGGGQYQFMCAVRAVSNKDGAVTEVALFPQGPQLLHQLAAVIR